MKTYHYSADKVQDEIDTAQTMLDTALMDIMMNSSDTLSQEAAETFAFRNHDEITKELQIKHEFKFGMSSIYLNMDGYISTALSDELDKVFAKHMTKAGFKHNEGIFTK